MIVRSEDLQHWTHTEPSPRQYLTTVAWLGSEFLAGGHAGAILTSPDGRVWSPSPVDCKGIVSRFARSGSLVVAVCQGGDILARTDGGAWKVVTNLKPSTGRDEIHPCAIAWSGNQFAAAGLVEQWTGDRSFSTLEWGGAMLTSRDGVNWAAQRCAKPVLDVVWTGSTFAAIRNDGFLMLSEDGSKWSTGLLPVVSGRSITWTGSEFAIGADNGVVLTGQEGSWKEHQPGFKGAAKCLTWTGTKLLVLAGDSVFLGTP